MTKRERIRQQLAVDVGWPVPAAGAAVAEPLDRRQVGRARLRELYDQEAVLARRVLFSRDPAEQHSLQEVRDALYAERLRLGG